MAGVVTGYDLLLAITGSVEAGHEPGDAHVERNVVERHDGDFGSQFIGYIGPTCGIMPTAVEGEWSIYPAKNYAFTATLAKRIQTPTPRAAIVAAMLLYP
jgi:hypothetical protein